MSKCHSLSLERVGFVQALARVRITQRERERVTLRGRVGRVTLLSQKRPIYMSKETCILVKRDLYTCRNIERERELVLRRLLRERESLRERVRESLSERETLKKVNMGWLRL